MREPVRLWVEALESDEYKQGRGLLSIRDWERNALRFCCLGVACELTPGIIKHNITSQCKYGESREGVELPVEAQQWLGFVVGDPVVKLPDGKTVGCMTLNDGQEYRWTFKQIAEAIRQQPDDWDGTYPLDTEGE